MLQRLFLFDQVMCQHFFLSMVFYHEYSFQTIFKLDFLDIRELKMADTPENLASTYRPSKRNNLKEHRKFHSKVYTWKNDLNRLLAHKCSQKPH